MSNKSQIVTFFCLRFKDSSLFDSKAEDSNQIHRAKKYADLRRAKVFRLKYARRLVEVSRFQRRPMSLSEVLENIEIVKIDTVYAPEAVDVFDY